MSVKSNYSDSELTSEQRLICDVIKSGIEEKDTEYLEGPTFDYHCNLIGLDPELVKRYAEDRAYVSEEFTFDEFITQSLSLDDDIYPEELDFER